MIRAQYEIKADCFGYSRGGCAVLTEVLCVTCGRCSFYKTREQAKADAERAHTAAVERGYYAKGGKYTPMDWGTV